MPEGTRQEINYEGQEYVTREAAQTVQTEQPDAIQNQTGGTSQWTLQQFNTIGGQPWMALQEHATDGSVTRQLTGYEHEVRELATHLQVTPLELPATTQVEFLSQHLTNPDEREYELGRQFAADRSRGIPTEFAPMSLDPFIKGMTDRDFEQKIRAENGMTTGQETSATTISQQVDQSNGTMQANIPEVRSTQREPEQQQERQSQATEYSMGISF